MSVKTALVLGLGTSGFASAVYLSAEGWRVRVADSRPEPALLPRLKEKCPGAEFHCGMDPSLLEGVSLLMISPGISPEHSDAAPLVAAARASGTDIVGEIELFARELKKLQEETGYSPKVIGVTGTNGKTTTTSLTTLMLNAGGISAVAAGNIGPNAVAELTRHAAEGTLPQAWVLELSSFQLETTESLRCDAAVITNVTQDHIDWHGGFDNYLAAKRRIMRPGTVEILNRDDSLSLESALSGETVHTFGVSKPERPGDFGLCDQGGVKWLAEAEKCEDGTALNMLMPAGALKIRGTHNAMNALTAFMLCRAAGGSDAAALRTLASYEGEPHRTQFVLSAAGIDFIDDSKGTDVGATAAGLQGLGETGEKSVVILGGDGKGQDFSPLMGAVRDYAAGVVTFGRDGDLIADAVRPAGVPMQKAKTLEEATRKAFAMAERGCAVLLSPACASWDMFPNYGVRAQVFRDEAAKISSETSQK